MSANNDMNRLIRRATLGLFIVIGIVAGTIVLGVALSVRKLERRVEVPRYSVSVPDDAASVARGGYLFASRGCAECHGADGGGRVFIDEPGGLRVRAPNISPGVAGVVRDYSVEDWVRTLRHGVKPDGRPLFIMPSEDYNRLTDIDTAALIAYLRQMPPATGGGMTINLPLAVRLAYGFGIVTDAAAKIDHQLPPQAPVQEGVTAEHGAYVAASCMGCHGAGLSGGQIPGAPPSWPAAANLTPGEGSAMQRYADADAFVAMMRSGQRGDGTSVSAVMPFKTFAAMNLVDLTALHLYLRSLPPRPLGER
jgi:mono/diheme cytochrome c family protein